MPMWKDTNMPGDFPLGFHNAILSGPGRSVIATGSEEHVRCEGNRFNAFRAAMRKCPSHRTSFKASQLRLRLSYERCEVTGEWTCSVLSVWKVFGPDFIIPGKTS